MNQLTLLFQLPGFSIDQIDIQAEVVILQAHVQASEAACPLCQHSARRVHSHYSRTLHDLPCGTRFLRLLVTVRRFFCDCTDRPRKIFAERLPDLTKVYAHTTTRFTQAVEALGFALGGKAAVRLGTQLGLARSRTTMLRTLRRATSPAGSTPRMLGVDDWAFRRGSSYGTLLVDLERSQPVDLLPDRQANTLATWLQAHPGVEVISRDRAGEYALGARQGTPQAVQVADRFHVLRNLADILEKSLHPHRRSLKQVHLVISTSPSALPAVRYERPARRRDKHRHQQEKRDLYETIRQLGAQGMSQVAIARLLHLNRKTVASYLHAEQFPQRASHPVRPSILTPYEAYLYGRWQEGYHNVVDLYREIQAQGYSGSRMPVQRYLLALRGLQEQGITLTKGVRTVEMTPRRALTLMLQRQEKLTEAQRSVLEEVCQLHPQTRLAYSLLEQFAQMLRNRRGEELDLWLQAAFHSGLPGMRAFVQKILQDQEAVQVGSFSNGTMGQWKARSTASNCSSEVCMDGLILTYCACESSIIESGHEPNSWIQYRLKDQTPLQLQSEALWLDASQLDCAFLTRQS